MATFKYIAQTKESNVTLNDVLTTGNTSEGTSYYNSSSETQYVYVETAPLAKFLAKDVFQASVNPGSYVTLDINSNFTLQTATVDVLKFVDETANIGGGTTPAHIECNLNNVTKDTFPNALVSEVSKSGIGKHFLIAIPSTRTDASKDWERANFTKLFKLIKSPTFRPDVNDGGASTANDGNVIITFNGRVKVAITEVKDRLSNMVIAKGNTILCDGTNLTVVCTDELYNEISKNGISSIKLEIVDNRSVKPITMASGEGFVGE